MPPSVGLKLLSAFFTFGAVMALLAFAGLLLPGGFLETMWHLNPQARVALTSLGWWGAALMLVVAAACALAAVGLSFRALWGYRLALAVLTISLVGDVWNALLRGDLRALVGVPIGGALIFYLRSKPVRCQFEFGSADL